MTKADGDAWATGSTQAHGPAQADQATGPTQETEPIQVNQTSGSTQAEQAAAAVDPDQATGPAGTGKLTRQENLAQVIKFALFSVSAGIIETVAFTVLDLATDWSYWPCYLIALILSVVWNFTLNREFTFKSANNVPVAMMKVAAFYCVFTPLSTWWGHALTSAGWNEYVVLLGTMAVNLTTEFLYDRFFVFRDSMNTNQRAQAGKKGQVGKSGADRNGECGATGTDRPTGADRNGECDRPAGADRNGGADRKGQCGGKEAEK